MGGEWNFVLIGDPSTINVKKYQDELLKIRQRYRSATQNVKEPPNNIFAKFTYECQRCKWHQGEPGVEVSTKAWWALYWDPTQFKKGFNLWGDIYARCSPRDFIYKSITMQRHLAINFPDHFQCYLGDGVNGYGDGDVYWGVKPTHYDSDDEGPTLDDIKENEWFLESINL